MPRRSSSQSSAFDRAGRIEATWRGSYSSDTNASSYTKSGATLGTAASSRYVIVAVEVSNGNLSTVPSGLTVGGVTATEIDTQTFYAPVSGNRSFVYFYKANVPTGPTGDIVVTMSGTTQRCGLSWWTCDGDIQITDDQVDKASGETPDNSLTVTIDKPKGGFVLAAMTGVGDGGDPTITWGGDGISENHDTGWGDVQATHSSASGNYSAAATSTVTATNTTGNLYYYILTALAFERA